MTDDDRQAALDAIAAEVRACTACRLHSGRRHAVPGEGSAETEVVFVGEGPGATEDEQGRPFVGAAGSLLEELIEAIGWRREDVFITNVVKCRPPGNRDPEPDEIAACARYLERQLAVLDPALVVTLGRFSLQTFMPGARISAAHGTIRPVDPATGAPDASAMALYHPAAAFRQVALRETLFADIAGAPEALIAARQRRAERRAAAGDDGPAMGADGLATTTDRPSAMAPRVVGSTDLDPAAATPADEAPPTDEAPRAAERLREPALAAADDPNQMRFF